MRTAETAIVTVLSGAFDLIGFVILSVLRIIGFFIVIISDCLNVEISVLVINVEYAILAYTKCFYGIFVQLEPGGYLPH